MSTVLGLGFAQLNGPGRRFRHFFFLPDDESGSSSRHDVFLNKAMEKQDRHCMYNVTWARSCNHCCCGKTMSITQPEL
jgi:hypothetical protein